MWHWDGHMGWMWMGLGWIIILALIGVVVWLAISASSRRGGARSTVEEPEDMLKRRYARGEIDRETYERMLEDVRK